VKSEGLEYTFSEEGCKGGLEGCQGWTGGGTDLGMAIWRAGATALPAAGGTG
jgi:hypothetical protein